MNKSKQSDAGLPAGICCDIEAIPASIRDTYIPVREKHSRASADSCSKQ